MLISPIPLKFDNHILLYNIPVIYSSNIYSSIFRYKLCLFAQNLGLDMLCFENNLLLYENNTVLH